MPVSRHHGWLAVDRRSARASTAGRAHTGQRRAAHYSGFMGEVVRQHPVHGPAVVPDQQSVAVPAMSQCMVGAGRVGSRCVRGELFHQRSRVGVGKAVDLNHVGRVEEEGFAGRAMVPYQGGCCRGQDFPGVHAWQAAMLDHMGETVPAGQRVDTLAQGIRQQSVGRL